MTEWKMAWRDGIAPELATSGLRSLAAALEDDDERLIQGETVRSKHGTIDSRYPIGAACAVVFAGWKDNGRWTILEGCRFLDDVIDSATGRLNGRCQALAFIEWYDKTKRAVMRRELLREVLRELKHRDLGD